MFIVQNEVNNKIVKVFNYVDIAEQINMNNEKQPLC